MGRIFSYYVKEKHMLTFEDAVRKITHLPATYLGIDATRGLIKEGYFADIVVFDPDEIAADFERKFAVGLEPCAVFILDKNPCLQRMCASFRLYRNGEFF